MLRNRNIICLICLFIILFVESERVNVLAKQEISSDQEQTIGMTTSYKDFTTISWKIVENFFKALAGIVSVINIIKFFFFDKKREIESIIVDLVSENFPENRCCTRLTCYEIKKNKNNIEQKKIENPFNLAVVIKLANPSKNVSHIVLKNVIFCIGEYTLKYKSVQGSFLWRKRCTVDEQHESCLIFLNTPTISNMQRGFNVVEAFLNPQDIHLTMKWRVMNIPVVSILNFLCLKPIKVDFEEIEYQSHIPRIGIKSKSIYRGK